MLRGPEKGRRHGFNLALGAYGRGPAPERLGPQGNDVASRRPALWRDRSGPGSVGQGVTRKATRRWTAQDEERLNAKSKAVCERPPRRTFLTGVACATECRVRRGTPCARQNAACATKVTPRPQQRDIAHAGFRTARAQPRAPGGNGSAPPPTRPPARGARGRPLPSAWRLAGPGATGWERPGPAASPAPRRHLHPHPHPVRGPPARASSLSLRGGTLASYSTRALVGSGSKHSTFSPEWNLNFMPSLALICSSWRRARLRGGRSARRGGGSGVGVGVGKWFAAAGLGGRERGMAEAVAVPPSVPPLPAPRRCWTSVSPGARALRARPRESPPASGRLRAGTAGGGQGLPLPPSWGRRLPRAAPLGVTAPGRALSDPLMGGD